MARDWLLITVSTPRGGSSTLRVYAWRKLRSLGAHYLQQSVCLLIEPYWETCTEPGCQAAVYRDGVCVKHGPDVWSAEAVEGLVAGESSEWTRGLEIDKRLMDAIRRASSVGSPTTEADRYALPMVDFAGATFKTPADFARTRFAGLAQFGGATFEQGAEFASAEFAEGCSFNQARFQGRAFFKAVTVAMGGWAGFTGIECDAVAAFNGITATNVDFSDSTFHALALFKGTFEANARLDRCRFEGTTEMGITVVCGSASIRDTEFGGFGEMARVCTRGEIDLEGSRFNEAFTLELNAEYIRLGRIHTIAGAQIKFSGDLDLSDANVEGSTLISPSDADHPDSEHRHTGEPRRARILSIAPDDGRKFDGVGC